MHNTSVVSELAITFMHLVEFGAVLISYRRFRLAVMTSQFARFSGASEVSSSRYFT